MSSLVKYSISKITRILIDKKQQKANNATASNTFKTSDKKE
ncbi:hypothetical protein [Jejuia spongiicola]|nr:hypothetical protein [Jejuia spongiicola]